MTTENMQTALQWFGDTYIAPLYQLIGGGLALLVLLTAIWFVLWPFLKRRIR